jgi:hypothetical protein
VGHSRRRRLRCRSEVTAEEEEEGEEEGEEEVVDCKREMKTAKAIRTLFKFMRSETTRPSMVMAALSFSLSVYGR